MMLSLGSCYDTKILSNAFAMVVSNVCILVYALPDLKDS